MHMKNALRFVFSGYSIWLEPEQFKGDLEVAIQTASKELGVLAVPVPHATAVYGISHLGESQVKERFRELASSIGEWPALEHKEFLSDIEIDGINGGLMVLEEEHLNWSILYPNGLLLIELSFCLYYRTWPGWR